MSQVMFGDTLANVGFVTTETSQRPLYVIWNSSSKDILYTIIMTDLDAPYPYPNNQQSPYLHMLLVNTNKTYDIEGKHLIKYMSPVVASNSLPHTYVVEIYEQQNNNQLESYQGNRENFKSENFAKTNNLKLVDKVIFKVGSMIKTKKNSENKNNIFKTDTTLPIEKQKFCSCVLKVADKQRGACNLEKAWFESRDGHKCYNPYSVCASSVGTTSRDCGKEYDFNNFSDNYLITYAQLHQSNKPEQTIIIPNPYNREQMLKNIQLWKNNYEK
jgi:phosphatidylethanolamine-binding protein (PEBP) family uncharacterized protein